MFVWHQVVKAIGVGFRDLFLLIFVLPPPPQKKMGGEMIQSN